MPEEPGGRGEAAVGAQAFCSYELHNFFLTWHLYWELARRPGPPRLPQTQFWALTFMRELLIFHFLSRNGMLILCDCFIYFIRFPWNVYVRRLPWLGGLLIYGSYKHSKVDMSVKWYNNIIQLQFCYKCADSSKKTIFWAPSPTPFLPATYAVVILEATDSVERGQKI